MYALACERRRISGCRLSSPLFFGEDKRQPEIRLRSQAMYAIAKLANIEIEQILRVVENFKGSFDTLLSLICFKFHDI